jgi:1,4-alpha-glucan branching enzyme
MTPALVLVLHAHLPFIRHPEHELFYEENWFFDALTETYVPLLWAIKESAEAGYEPRLTMSLTPPLLSMMGDELLMKRYERFLGNRLDLIQKEIALTKNSKQIEEARLALFYAERYLKIRKFLFEEYKGKVIDAFRELASKGYLELITCAATHGFLPLMREYPGAVRAQLEMGVKTHKRFLGVAPRGIWLPECAFYPGLDEELRELGIEFFFVDSHGLVNGNPYPLYDVYAPIVTPAGAVVFARDPLSSSQVWSSETGYPGNPRYREFYRDLGWDRDFEYIKDHILPDGSRVNTGLKYRRVTGQTNRKDYYDPYHAQVQVQDHARHFVSTRINHSQRLAKRFHRRPVITAPFDAELFGHWWFEGPMFLSAVFREIQNNPRKLEALTAAEIIDTGDALQEVSPSASTWGAGGYHSVWLNPENDVLLGHYEEIYQRMTRLAELAPAMSSEQVRAAKQAGREALLAQASDWAFLITKDTAGFFAKRQVATHIRDFFIVEKMAREGAIDEEMLASIEDRDNIFPDIEIEFFGPRQ